MPSDALTMPVNKNVSAVERCYAYVHCDIGHASWHSRWRITSAKVPRRTVGRCINKLNGIMPWDSRLHSTRVRVRVQCIIAAFNAPESRA